MEKIRYSIIREFTVMVFILKGIFSRCMSMVNSIVVAGKGIMQELPGSSAKDEQQIHTCYKNDMKPFTEHGCKDRNIDRLTPPPISNPYLYFRK